MEIDRKIKVSLISYTNTKPFGYGLKNFPGIQDQLSIQMDSPKDCAQKLIQDQVDLGIVPSAALLDLPYYEILSDYCIGTLGKVNSVFLFSQIPISAIQTIYLDEESRTSNGLAQILAQKFWKINPIWKVFEANEDKFPSTRILIGDRTFIGREKYPYQIDLGLAWKEFTGLPFVFAVWASNKTLDPKFISLFNKALAFGLDHRKEVLEEIQMDPSFLPQFDYHHYLYQNLSFELNDSKRLGLETYLKYLKDLRIH